MIFRYKGVRYRCITTGTSHWSGGKVHLQYWSREDKQWVTACRPNDVGPFSGYHFHDVVSPDAEITCKNCQKKDPR